MINVKYRRDECDRFPGGWSLNAAQMWVALNAARRDQPLHVLEFGAGRATPILAELLAAHDALASYVCYETNPRYICSHPLVECRLCDPFPPEQLLLADSPDLIIIDGPNGVGRAAWYPLLTPFLAPGAVIVIDDFDHYAEFAAALDHNINYVLVEHVNIGRPKGAGSVVCWKTVRVI